MKEKVICLVQWLTSVISPLPPQPQPQPQPPPPTASLQLLQNRAQLTVVFKLGFIILLNNIVGLFSCRVVVRCNKLFSVIKSSLSQNCCKRLFRQHFPHALQNRVLFLLLSSVFFFEPSQCFKLGIITKLVPNVWVFDHFDL